MYTIKDKELKTVSKVYGVKDNILKSISNVYAIIGGRLSLVWTAIKDGINSVFGLGYWKNDEGWNNEDSWKNSL